MNPVPVSVGAPHTAAVNLLPPEIEIRRKQKQAKLLIVVAVALFFVLVAGAWFYAFSVRVVAESELVAEQNRTPAKYDELAEYDYIPVVQKVLANAVMARAWAGSTDVNWATQLNSVFTNTPSGISLTNVVVAGSSPSNPVSLDGTPFQQPDLGQLSFAGNAANVADVIAFQDALDELPAFQNTSITSVTIAAVAEGDVAYWTFTGSTRITVNALSGRVETEQPLVSVSSAAESEG